MRSGYEAVSIDTILLKYVVNELTQATCWIHDELDASTTANVGVVVESAVLEGNGCSTTPWIHEHAINSGAVKVDAGDECSVVEHNE